MKINDIILLASWFLVSACTIQRDVVIPQSTSTPGTTIPKTVDPIAPITGEWTQEKGGAGGFTNYNSFKNFQYNFVVETSNQPVSIQLTSADIDVQFALYDPLGQLVSVQGTGRNISQQYTLNAGTYRLVVTADRQAVGKFSLAFTGTKAGATLIPSQILQSGTQSWGPLGGGGADLLTYKNVFYTFDATEDNFSPDVELLSPDTDVVLFVYDALGQLISGYYYTGSRYQYFLDNQKKGTYTIVAATKIRGSVGNFNLIVTGKVANLTKVTSQSATVTGSWASGSTSDTYSIELTANTSPLDISLSSAETKCQIELQSSAGARLLFTGAQTSPYIIGRDLAKGTYLIKVSPGYFGSGGQAGNYTLSVFGQFANFKKL